MKLQQLCAGLGVALLTAPLAAAPIMVGKTAALPDSPQAAGWQQAAMVEVAVLPQQMAMPMLAQAAVTALEVQALSDGQAIAWRVSWPDPAPDFNVDTGRFADAVALEFPVGENPAAMMGHKNAKVQILYWKALWQKDLDSGFQDIQVLYPNMWSDLYWFAEGGPPYPVPDAFKNPVSHQWFIAKQAGNPGAVFERSQPVEELSAEGWGTLTHQPDSVTSGAGMWQNGQWTVMFSRPLNTDDPNDHRFTPKGQVAFAVWQGSTGNSGGRKHWTNWVEYQLQ